MNSSYNNLLLTQKAPSIPWTRDEGALRDTTLVDDGQARVHFISIGETCRCTSCPLLPELALSIQSLFAAHNRITMSTLRYLFNLTLN